MASEVEASLNLPDGQTLPWQPERPDKVFEPHVKRSGFRRILHRSGGYEDMLTIPLLPVFHRELECALPVKTGAEALRALDAIFPS